MTGDGDLSCRLTAAIRETDGVTGVYAAQPVLEAAATSIVAALDLRPPDELVDIDRDEDFVTVAAHVATADTRPAADVVRAVAEMLRAELEQEPTITSPVAINVKVRLIEV